MSAPRVSLLEGDVALHIRRLAIPLAWGLLMLNIFMVVDTYFISFLGTNALAAFGFCLPVVMIFMGIIFGFCVGTTSALSRVYGSGDLELMKQMTTDALLLSALISTAAAIGGMLSIDPVFRLMGAPPDIMPLIHDFMHYWYIGLPFLCVMMAGNACIRATGDTVFPSSMMTLQAVVLIIIDPFLIFGWAGLPRLELMGAAMTLMIAYIMCCGVSLYVMAFRRKIIGHGLFHAGTVKSWRRILHVGLPSIASNQIFPVSAAIITWLASRFGVEAVAALGVAGRIENVVMLVNYSLGAAIAIFIGQNFGAGNFGRVREATVTAARYCLFYGLFMAVVLWLAAPFLAAAFSSSALVQSYVAQYFHWVPVSYGAFGAMLMGNSSFNAIGRPLPGMSIMFLKAFGLYVPLAYVGQIYLGFTGIIAALMVTNFIVGALSYLWNTRSHLAAAA